MHFATDCRAVLEPLLTWRVQCAPGEAQLDVLPFHELEEPFAVSVHVAADFGESSEFPAFGLRDVEPETFENRTGAAGCYLGFLSSDPASSVPRFLPIIRARIKMRFPSA